MLDTTLLLFCREDPGERGIADSLELYQARHAMHSPAVVLGVQETVNRLANTLLSTKHGGFPVVRDVVGVERYSGLVSRSAITLLYQPL